MFPYFCAFQGWRVCYYGAGIIGLIIAILTGLTIKEPERQVIGEETANDKGSSKKRDWSVLLQPRVILICIAASIRHTGWIFFFFL